VIRPPAPSSGSGSRGVDTAAIRSRCQASIAESRKFLSANLLVRSYQALDRASSSAIDADLKAQITALAKSIEESGTKLLAEADKNFADGKYTEAMRQYRIVSSLGKLKVATTARAKINQAEKDPAFAAVVRNAKAAEIYSTIHAILQCKLDEDHDDKATPVKADSLDDGGSGAGSEEADVDAHVKRALKATIDDQVRLMTTLDQVITTYAGTPSAVLAEQLRGKLVTNKAFAAAVEKQKKEDLLKNGFEWAQQNERSGFPAKAIEAYKKVIADGPGTDWAFKAQAKIDSIERMEKLKKSMQ